MSVPDEFEAVEAAGEMTAAGAVELGSAPSLDEQARSRFARDLVEQARSEGVNLVGPDGLLTGVTKTVLETALEAEMREHVGYDKHAAVGRNGRNSRNGTRPKTVVTEVGEVTISVPRDRDGTFEPVIVRKRPSGGCQASTNWC